MRLSNHHCKSDTAFVSGLALVKDAYARVQESFFIVGILLLLHTINVMLCIVNVKPTMQKFVSLRGTSRR